jgi:hypothetical protein
MSLTNRTIRGQLAAATAVLLAGSSTKTRYVRSALFINNTNAQRTFNYAHAATATSAGPGVFGEVLPANTSGPASRAMLQFGGKGARLDNVAISGFADAATSVTYEINYDESDTVDA